jgi:peptide/nickel transport system substrate-binding protein
MLNKIKIKKINAIGTWIALITIVGFITLSGCIDKGGTEKNEAEQKLGASQELIIGSPWAPKSINPYSGGSYILQRNCIIETLVSIDYEGKLAPGLAESWEVSDDGLTWTFHLREHVKFHDDTPFNADAMKSSLERAMQEAAIFKNVPVDSVKTKDDHTLIITTNESFAPLPAYLTKGESAPISSSSFDENGTFLEPVGTGPFKFESWKPNEEIRLVKNDDYWGTKPKLDTVVYKGVPEAITRVMMARAGELNIAQILPPDAVNSLESEDNIDVFTKSIARTRLIGFNMEKEPFSEQKVRQAVNYAIDRDALVKYVLEGVGTPAKCLFPPEFYWANTDLNGYTYDPTKARKLLEEAGWVDTDDDGVLDKNGKPFEITLLTYTERAALPPTAEMIQSQLGEVGIKSELNVLKYDAASEIKKAGEFDMFLVGRGLLFIPDPDSIMMEDYHSTYGVDGVVWYGYHNERVNELIDNGRVTMDTKERKRIYDEVQKLVFEDAPIVYLNYYVNIDAVDSSVHGYQMHPNEYSFHLENVYIE